MRHLAKLTVTGELLRQWLPLLPEGAELVGAGIDRDAMLELCFSHPSFPEVVEGGIPEPIKYGN